MSHALAQNALPSLPSLVVAPADRTRANAPSLNDAANAEFAKLLQKAMAAPEGGRSFDDAPAERETVSLDALSLAQGFATLDRVPVAEAASNEAASFDAPPTANDCAPERGAAPAPAADPGGVQTPTVPAMAPAPSAPPQNAGSENPAAADAADATPAVAPTRPPATGATPGPSTTPVGPSSDATPTEGAPTQVPGFAAELADAAAPTRPPIEDTPATAPIPANQIPTAPRPEATPVGTPPPELAEAAQTKASTRSPLPASPSDVAALSATAAPATAMTATTTDNAVREAAPSLAIDGVPAAAEAAVAIMNGGSPAGTRSNVATPRAAAAAPIAAGADTPVTSPTESGSAAANLTTEAPPRAAPHPPAALAAQLAQEEPSTPAVPPPAIVAPQAAAAPAPTVPVGVPAAAGDLGEARIDALETADGAAARTDPTGREAAMIANSTPVATDQAVARAQRITVHPAIAQVAVSVTKAVQEGVDRITIKLQPPELGRIDVRIDVGVDGRIQAVFAAERPATMEILQRDVRELERALQNAGLSTDAGSLSFGLKQQGGGRYAPFAASAGAGAPAADTDPGADTPVARNAARRRADGHLDIHV
ncbi:MAG: flagellar hook-length control protein FliK [Alphaproteobacteria bacterium]|nr:flagellar hook-length control protein FliK [Alphaproteobacteria bacterium]